MTVIIDYDYFFNLHFNSTVKFLNKYYVLGGRMFVSMFDRICIVFCRPCTYPGPHDPIGTVGTVPRPTKTWGLQK